MTTFPMLQKKFQHIQVCMMYCQMNWAHSSFILTINICWNGDLRCQGLETVRQLLFLCKCMKNIFIFIVDKIQSGGGIKKKLCRPVVIPFNSHLNESRTSFRIFSVYISTMWSQNFAQRLILDIDGNIERFETRFIWGVQSNFQIRIEFDEIKKYHVFSQSFDGSM